jgi:hypothetical protein
MKALWIRVDANLGNKPFVLSTADALGVSVSEAIGLLVQLWGNVAYHARRADLSKVSDSAIENWADWRRKKGKFAAHIRAHHLDAEGRIRAWEDYAGHLEDRREKDDSPDGKSTYVYYAVDGEHCKIGWSGNPWSRVHEMKTARPAIAIAAVERGTRDLERTRHSEFLDARIEREWFQLTPGLAEHIRRLSVVGRSEDRSSNRSEDRSNDGPTTDATTVAPAHMRARANGTERNGTERNGTSPLEAFQPTFKTRGGEAAADDPKTRAAPPADAGNATAEPHRDTTRFLDTYYPTHDRRRGDVERQMAATLTVGAKLDRNTLIRAGSVDRLAAKCRETIDEGVRDADKAIVVLLRKLADTSDGSAPGVTAAKADADEQRRDEQTTAADEATAERWLNDHLTVAASIEEQLNRDGLAGEDDFTRMSRRVARRALVLAAWSKAELPRANNG